METSTWAEVELRAHAAILDIPEHIFVATNAQPRTQGEKEALEPEIVAQGTPKRKGRKGKKLPSTRAATQDHSPQGDVLTPLEGTALAELEPDTADLLGGGLSVFIPGRSAFGLRPTPRARQEHYIGDESRDQSHDEQSIPE